MDSDNRLEWAEVFEKIAGKISALDSELTDNKDVNEFIREMESLKKKLENEIESFKRAIEK